MENQNPENAQQQSVRQLKESVVPQKRFCKYCGTELIGPAAFCPSCGKPQGNMPQQSTGGMPGQTAQGMAGQPMQGQQLNYGPQPFMGSQPAQSTNASQGQNTTVSSNSNVNTTVVVEGHKSNGLGTAGFVLSLLALLVSWVPVVDLIVWFLGALFSFIGLFKRPRGLAIAGFIISFIGIIILVVFFGSILAFAK